MQHRIPTSSIEPRQNAANILAAYVSAQELEASLDEVARLLTVAKKPIIYAGQDELSHPNDPVLLGELFWKAHIPVKTTLLGPWSIRWGESKSSAYA